MTNKEAIEILTSKHTHIMTDICDDKEYKKLNVAFNKALDALKEVDKINKEIIK